MRRFVLRFSLAAALLLGAYYFPYDPRGLGGLLLRLYLATYARAAGGAIGLFDGSVHVDGTHIVGRTTLDFALSCDAMDVLCLFAAATYGVDASWRARALGVGVAGAAMVAINIARIVMLYFIAIYAPSRFELFHMEIFPLAIVLAAVAGFLLWIRSSAAPAAATVA